jgi:hypothetical protein
VGTIGCGNKADNRLRAAPPKKKVGGHISGPPRLVPPSETFSPGMRRLPNAVAGLKGSQAPAQKQAQLQATDAALAGFAVDPWAIVASLSAVDKKTSKGFSQ